MKIRLLLLLPLLIVELRAQTSLSDYRAQVLGYSLDIKKSDVSVNSSIEGLAKSRTFRLPTLSMSGNFDYNMRSIDGQKSWRFDLQPQLTQTLYGGGAMSAEIESSRLSAEVAICDRDFTYLEVVYSADYAYWNLLSMGRYLRVVRSYVEIIKSLKEVIDRRFDEGYTSKGDVLMIATRLSEAEYGLVSVEQLYDVALHNFNILRGAEADAKVTLERVDVGAVMAPKRVSLEEVLERRPDYESIQLKQDISRQAIRSVKATYNPSLSVGVLGSWAPNIPNINGRTEVNGIAFATLSTTIFHFGERRRAVSVAELSYISSQLDDRVLRDAIAQEEADGWTTLIDRQAQVVSTSKSLNIASENLEISTFSYGEGETTILDVMQAQLSWIQIYTNAVNAEFNYLVSISSYNKIIVGYNVEN